MIFDLTQIYNELDLLEIRLNILDPHVDFFVIGECEETFSGKKKPLFYLENRERFVKWSGKIIHVIIPPKKFDDVFERTAYQKDYLRTALKNLAKPNDIVYYGDCDEIWKPQVVGNEIYKLRQLNYCYYLNMRSSENWEGTNVCKYKNLPNLNEFRANHDHVLEDGGWHFTNQGGAEQIKLKLQAYDHQEANTPENLASIEERMKKGEDYIGRRKDWQGKTFEFWVDDSEIPLFLAINRTRFSHLFML